MFYKITVHAVDCLGDTLLVKFLLLNLPFIIN